MQYKQGFLRKLLVFLIPISLLSPIQATHSASSLSTCAANQFSVTANHNPIFYYDNGTTITSGYAQFGIKNNTGAAVANYSVKLVLNSAAQLSIAANESATQQILIPSTSNSLANGSTYNAYWYLTASAVSANAQSFDVEILDETGAGICKVTKSFTSTASTISASSNKITSVSYSSLSSPDATGSSTFTATVKGATGTIGAGPSGNYDVNLNPSTTTNFNSGSYRLYSTEYKCVNASGATISGTTVTDSLYIANACQGNYVATFSYRYLYSPSGGDNALSPIMQIASGTQMKHTTTPSFTIAAIGAPSVATNAATSIATTSATLNGSIGSGTFGTDLFFCFSGTSPGANFTLPCTDSVTATSSGGNYIFNRTGLTAGTTYYFEFYGVSGGQNYKGGLKSFTTLAAGVTTTTKAATGVDTTTATLNGELTGLVSANISTYYFLISAVDPSPDHLDPSSDDSTTATVNTSGSPYVYASSPTGLTAGTKYYFELIIVDTNGGIYYGGVLDFTTSTVPTPSSGGGSAPVVTPNPPTINSISASEVCAVGERIRISGTFLSRATVTVDGAAARVISSDHFEMIVELPGAVTGIKTIKVSNADGSASATIKYSFADRPVYVNFLYPETFKDRAFSYTFTATDAAKYEISGTMPTGLTLNSLTGEISGAPTQTGDFIFEIIASNICASTALIVYMFVDKAIPETFTCSVAFNVPASDNITEQKLINLKNCLSKTTTLSPKYIDPVIFISGGIPAGLTPDQALTHPRYLPILDLIQSMNLNAQIYLGAFNGSTDSVQLNVYWPEPS